MKTPFRLSAWLTNNARIVLHLNSVSDSATLVIRADNAELYRTNLPNLDGGLGVNNEYNMDITVNLPSGRRLIEVTNAGGDWFFLDWVRLENVLPANYAGNWLPSPDAIGLRGQRESLLYVVAPGVSFPSSATNATLPVQQGQAVTLTNWPGGSYFAEWYDPTTGSALGTSQSTATNGSLTLALPDFQEDLAGLVYPPPALSTPSVTSNGAFAMQLQAETGGRYLIEKSADLTNWTAFLLVTNSQPPETISEASARTNSKGFFRAKRP